MASITINGITIDPTAPKARLAALSLDNADAKKSDYVLVQTKDPLNKAQRPQLAKAGVEILEAVPGGAFICHFPKTNLNKVRSLPFVAWADLYSAVVKIAPALQQIETVPGGVNAAAAMLPLRSNLDAAKVTVDVVLHRNANVKSMAKRVADAAHLNAQDVKIAGHKLRLTLKTRRLADVAALDNVRHLEKVFPRKLANNVAHKILRVPGPGQAKGAEGKGEIVAIADTGFDKGSTTDVHPAFTGRVKKLYALGRHGRKDDPDGHGTHVAGSVLGDGISTADGPIRGTAPGAQLVFQSVLDSRGELGGLPDNLGDLFGPPYKTDNAHVHAADVGDVPMKSRFSLEECHADIEAFFGVVRAASVIPLAVGGDHSITYPLLKALGRDQPVGMVHIYAHCDTGRTFEGSKFHHGGPFRHAVLDGVLAPERSIQIGIHGGAEYLWEFSVDSGMTVLHMEDVAEMGVPAVIEKTRKVIGDGPTYVTFDIDGIDPGFAPGIGTPEVGGLTPREVLAILRGIAGAHIIGST